MIDTGDVALRVNRYEGNGPEVLLVHGIGSSSRDFDPAIDGLAAFTTPISVDLRGHGESGKPESGYHYGDYVRDIDALLGALGMEHPIILGHSLGGIITLFWAIQHPDCARALIIEDSPLRSGEEFRPAFEGWTTLNALPFQAVRDYYARENPGWPNYLAHTRAWDITNTHPAAISELMATSMSNDGLDATGGMRDITAPVLFIHGDPETGSMVHPADLATLPERLPTVQIAHIPGGTHTMHRTRIPEWLEIVRKFVTTRS
jgi:pimeloyl-ACP methyl ester carboxylesterase